MSRLFTGCFVVFMVACGPATRGDAVGHFGALKHHGEALAFVNPESHGAPDPSAYDHYQGIVRRPGAGPPIFYVTQSDDDDPGAPGGYLHVVQLPSRPHTGERLRSNLQVRGKDTAETTPPRQDSWTRSIRLDGSLVFGGVRPPAYHHPGGAAVVDDVLIVPVDDPVDRSQPRGQLLLFDLAPDGAPKPLRAIALNHRVDHIAITKRASGHFLLWTNGAGGTKTRFYKTNGLDLRAESLDLSLLQIWLSNRDLEGGHWHEGANAHQSATFIREEDGELYLLGLRHPGGLPGHGQDYADLYHLTTQDGLFLLTREATRRFDCVYEAGEHTRGPHHKMRLCNFAAGSSAHVTPQGELILYALPHDDEDAAGEDFVRLAEFRHQDVSRPESALRDPELDRPWFELYEDVRFENRSIVVDYDDQDKLELHNFRNLDRFDDRPSSVRWRAPEGIDIHLYDKWYFSRDGQCIVLEGTGQTEHIDDLNGVSFDRPHVSPCPGATPRRSFTGRISSARFVK
jgi:hypothetical protein